MRIIDNIEHEFKKNGWDESFEGTIRCNRLLNETTYASPLYFGSMLYCSSAIKNIVAHGHRTKLVKPDFLSCRLIESGSEYGFYNGKYFLAEVGDLMIFKPYFDYAFYTGPQDHCVKYNLTFKGEIVDEILHSSHLEEAFAIHLDDLSIYNSFYAQIRELLANESLFNRSANASLSFGFLQTLGDLITNRPPEQFRKMQHYIEQHLRDNIDLQMLSKAFGLSKTSINLIFQKVMGCSTYKYITERKMNFAVNLLTNEMFSVKEVAAELGFANSFSFSREFKKFFGISPRTFKQKNQ